MIPIKLGRQKWLIVFIIVIIFISIMKLILHISTKYTFNGATVTDSHGQVYYDYTHTGWKAIESDKKIGWVDDPNSIFNYSVFSVKGDDAINTIIVRHPLKEFDSYLRRPDVTIPEISIDNIGRVELANAFKHRLCNNGATDKHIISEIINIIKESKIVSPIKEGASYSKELLLYSDKLPGSAYPIIVFKMEDEYWLEYDVDETPTRIDESILREIPGCE